jgi:hypothetical protein
MPKNQQTQQKADQRVKARAIEIYEYALAHDGEVFSRSQLVAPTTNLTRDALGLLVDRGLLKSRHDIHRVLHYQLAQVIEPKNCMARPSNDPIWRGCKIYRVSPAIAATYGHRHDVDLTKYAIGEVVSC